MTTLPPELEALMPNPWQPATRAYPALFTADQVRQAMLDATERAAKKAAADTRRLDWLDGLNSVMNKHYGTTYQWRLVLSPNVVRLMAGRHDSGYIGDIDLHDSDARGVASCRIAIDGAIEATNFKLAAAIRGGGQG